MFIATHKKIANSAYDMLDVKLQVLIDRDSLIKGSYLPDTNLKYAFKWHNYEDTIKFVKDKIEEILSNEHCSKTLGKKLGFICHFIADYCSPFHTNKNYNKRNLFSHINYERKTRNNLDFIFVKDYELKNRFFLSLETLVEDMEEFINKYMQGEKNIKKEAKYALLNSYHIINLIMTEYIKIHVDNYSYIDLIPLHNMPIAAYSPSKDLVATSNFEEVEYL